MRRCIATDSEEFADGEEGCWFIEGAELRLLDSGLRNGDGEYGLDLVVIDPDGLLELGEGCKCASRPTIVVAGVASGS